MDKLNEYIEAVEKALDDGFPDENTPQGRCAAAARYSLSAGGKRIRPVLTLAFCEMCGGSPGNAIDAACALEYMHTFSLIHDDLPCMDNDDLRRGKPSCHKAFDEATALLAGDALAILPFERIARSRNISPKAALKCIYALSHCCGIDGMTGGQQIDTENDGKELDRETLLKMYSMKTSALLKAACLCGVYCAESANESLYARNAAEYAENLGLAFQIIDDILDVTSSAEVLGKPAGSDSANDKHTFVSIYGLEAAERAASEYTGKAEKTLDVFENNGFLKQLTKMLLSRKK